MNVKKLFDLSDKTIILTGAAGFLGSSYVDGLSQAGANVVLCDVNLQGCKKIENNIKKKYDTNPISVKLDVTNTKSIENLIKKVTKKYSRIDVLINNAAYQGDSKIRTVQFEELDINSWNKAIDVNLTGIFQLCQQVGKVMLKQKSGNVINISSIYGIVGADQRIYGSSGLNSAVFYATTKSAILNLTRYLASYWNRTGIRVNTLSPGGVQNKQNKDFIKKYSEKTMIGRMAKNDEYVGALVFLCSDASSYMTGSNLIIDGGWTAW
tara:strand:- start:19097 stop:19894 length:798 start_codon:yes stop_codon:yes gene_type:complete